MRERLPNIWRKAVWARRARGVDLSKGQPMALDPNAESANPDLPAFLARPDGSPPYHGFPLERDICVDGFTLGLISASLGTDADWGDAYVVAPDGRRAGIAWAIAYEAELIDDLAVVDEIIPDEGARFGVFSVVSSHGPTSQDEALLFLEEILPFIRERWERSA